MSNKHDANVRKSTLVNFQIGLIASLLFTYVMFEVYTSVPIVKEIHEEIDISEEMNFTMDTFVIEQEPQKKIAAKVVQPKIPDLTRPEIVEDDTVLEDLKEEFKSEEPVETAPFNPDALVDKEEDDEPANFPFTVVEDVPVFPGCEKLRTNKEKAACFSKKIQRLVSRKFNSELGQEYGLQGLQRIHVQFDVARDGSIQDILVRAPHPALEKEARRVVKLFPIMTPGRQRGKAVTVKYQLPISFRIQN